MAYLKHNSLLIVSLLVFGFIFFKSHEVLGYKKHRIQHSINDEVFIIGGEKYKAKTYCFGFDKDDNVIFLKGTPGICVSAKLIHLRSGKSCDVWCE